jgi:hypothetical protein
MLHDCHMHMLYQKIELFRVTKAFSGHCTLTFTEYWLHFNKLLINSFEQLRLNIGACDYTRDLFIFYMKHINNQIKQTMFMNLLNTYLNYLLIPIHYSIAALCTVHLIYNEPHNTL